MGFFAQPIAEDDVLEVPIPEDYYLHITQICVAPEVLEKKKLPGAMIIYAKTANDEEEYAVAVLNPAQNLYHTSLTLEFGVEDSPISLRASTGAVHVSGKWSWDEDECRHNHDEEGSDDEDCDEDDDDEEEEEDESSEDDEEAPMLVELEDEPAPAPVPANSNTKKQKLDCTASNKQQNDKEKAAAVEEPSKKKVRVEVPPAASTLETITATSALKPWKVYPDCDEGVPVPEPKTIKKGGGLEITDYIIGNGEVPRGGAIVKILYEGLFPNGKVFDQKLKRKSPFSFRKGTGQVIPGMDKGIEGMKIGGSREIVIPPHLGYGEKGVADIPGNQTLIFRIRLVG